MIGFETDRQTNKQATYLYVRVTGAFTSIPFWRMMSESLKLLVRNHIAEPMLNFVSTFGLFLISEINKSNLSRACILLGGFMSIEVTQR